MRSRFPLRTTRPRQSIWERWNTESGRKEGPAQPSSIGEVETYRFHFHRISVSIILADKGDRPLFELLYSVMKTRERVVIRAQKHGV